jgi:pentatricopeptide repeat protein
MVKSYMERGEFRRAIKLFVKMVRSEIKSKRGAFLVVAPKKRKGKERRHEEGIEASTRTDSEIPFSPLSTPLL